jgi:hypothetical protein
VFSGVESMRRAREEKREENTEPDRESGGGVVEGRGGVEEDTDG